MERETLIAKVQNRTKTFIGLNSYNSVLMPFYYDRNASEWKIILQLRAPSMSTQPGEISFPGGKIEESETAQQAAIRETREELGVEAEKITMWGELDQLITPFNLSISCFIGEVHTAPQNFRINPDEVAEVFSIPLNFFTSNPPRYYDMNVKVEPDPEFPFELIQGGRNYQFRTGNYPSYFYFYQDRVIWGFTARIIKNFIDIAFF